MEAMLIRKKLEAFFDILKFSKLKQILLITAWIQEFVHKAKKLVSCQKKNLNS